jgi:hypothetical protein
MFAFLAFLTVFVQNLEFRKIHYYKTNYCKIMMHVESGSYLIKSPICSLPMQYHLYKCDHIMAVIVGSKYTHDANR